MEPHGEGHPLDEEVLESAGEGVDEERCQLPWGHHGEADVRHHFRDQGSEVVLGFWLAVHCEELVLLDGEPLCYTPGMGKVRVISSVGWFWL